MLLQFYNYCRLTQRDFVLIRSWHGDDRNTRTLSTTKSHCEILLQILLQQRWRIFQKSCYKIVLCNPAIKMWDVSWHDSSITNALGTFQTFNFVSGGQFDLHVSSQQRPSRGASTVVNPDRTLTMSSIFYHNMHCKQSDWIRVVTIGITSLGDDDCSRFCCCRTCCEPK